MPYTGVELNTDTTLDLWKLTLKSYKWSDKTCDYLFPLHHFVVADLWMAKDKIVPEPGTEIKRQVIYRENGSATFVNPGEVRERATLDVVAEINLPFIGQIASHSILAAEVRRNVGRAQLKKLATGRRQTAMVDMLKSLESRAWAMPDTSGNKYPHGIPYWIVPITGAQATATPAGAHQGGNPTGFSDCAGLSAADATYARWKSYNGTWDNSTGDITETCLERMGRMFRRLKWRAPAMVDDLKQPKFQKLRMYTDETIIDAYSRAMRKGRDDLSIDPTMGYGAGLSSQGDPVFKGFPLIWVEELDTADTTNRGANPLYMINHDYFYPVVETGCYFREDVPMRTVDQPDVFTTWVDLNFNFLCENRQLGGGLISYVTPA